jgi:hypothetical protein
MAYAAGTLIRIGLSEVRTRKTVQHAAESGIFLYILFVNSRQIET